MNNLAWLLSTASDEQFRDSRRAVELADKAVELAPENPDYLGTLGVARYRTGDLKQATLDLESAIKIRGSKNPTNANESFFLAMTYWQLGDKAAARTWFDKGVAWMEKAKSPNDEVRRFRAEAVELLGIKDAAKRAEPEHPSNDRCGGARKPNAD
jgi:Flp pilus assembly protein TadD